MEVNSKTIKEIVNERFDDEGNESDLSDVGLCSLNRFEHQYNVMICSMFTGDYEKALKLVTGILKNAEPDYADKCWLIRGIIHTLRGKIGEATSNFKAARDKDALQAKAYLDRKEPVMLNVFPEKNRLCSYFPYTKLVVPGFPCVVLLKRNE